MCACKVFDVGSAVKTAVVNSFMITVISGRIPLSSLSCCDSCVIPHRLTFACVHDEEFLLRVFT